MSAHHNTSQRCIKVFVDNREAVENTWIQTADIGFDDTRGVVRDEMAHLGGVAEFLQEHCAIDRMEACFNVSVSDIVEVRGSDDSFT